MTRLKELRKAKNLTQAEVADFLGITRAAYTNIENGKREPDNSTLVRLSEYFNTSTDYLLERISTMYGPPEPTAQGSKWVPVLGTIPAGVPIEAVEEILGWEEIPASMVSQGEHFALKVKGDSMEPRIHAGDVVIVRQQSTCESGDVAVVFVNGDEATLKRIKKEPGGLMLIPNNSAYEPMFFTNEQIETLPVRIAGKVVELRAKF